jgi:hypothetical protein
MNDKTFTVVGVSYFKGSYKARFANDMSRVKVLTRGGHTDVRLFELASEMTQVEAATFALGLEEFADESAQTALRQVLESAETKSAVREPKEPKVAKEPKEKKTPKINQESKAIAEARAVAARDRELAAMALAAQAIDPAVEDEPF